MRIIFVRHGHPNYKDDCLTPLGHEQAKAAAERLKSEKIDEFYSSSCGRAYETALHIAQMHHKPVQKLDFMKEIQWGPKGGMPHADYNPWLAIGDMVKKGEKTMDLLWEECDAFKNNFVSERVHGVASAFDNWLCEFGYERCSDYYKVTRENHSVILLASHGGSSSSVFSHLLNIPFTAFCASFTISFTGITVVDFGGDVGSIIAPKIVYFNDAQHLNSVETENKYEM